MVDAPPSALRGRFPADGLVNESSGVGDSHAIFDNGVSYGRAREWLTPCSVINAFSSIDIAPRFRLVNPLYVYFIAQLPRQRHHGARQHRTPAKRPESHSHARLRRSFFQVERYRYPFTLSTWLDSRAQLGR